MANQILMAVDGSERACLAASALGQLLKNSPDQGLLLFLCVQRSANLYPGEIVNPIFESRGFEAALDSQRKVGEEVLGRSLEAVLDTGFPKERVELKLKLDSTDPAVDILAEAQARKIQSIALGRRGLNKMQNVLLGSISSKVAQQSQDRAVWIVDTPVPPAGGVLVAVEGIPECHTLTNYASEFFGPLPSMRFTFLNLIPSRPPTFWDDGHILSEAEQMERDAQIKKWKSEWVAQVKEFMEEGREFLLHRGVVPDSIHMRIEEAKEGVSRDLLNDIASNQYQIVVIGKKSFKKRAPFLIGSHANKLLQNLRQAILCVVG